MRALRRRLRFLRSRPRLHDAHLVGRVATRQLERLVRGAREPRFEVRGVRQQDRHALVVDARGQLVRLVVMKAKTSCSTLSPFFFNGPV